MTQQWRSSKGPPRFFSCSEEVRHHLIRLMQFSFDGRIFLIRSHLVSSRKPVARLILCKWSRAQFPNHRWQVLLLSSRRGGGRVQVVQTDIDHLNIYSRHWLVMIPLLNLGSGHFPHTTVHNRPCRMCGFNGIIWLHIRMPLGLRFSL